MSPTRARAANAISKLACLLPTALMASYGIIAIAAWSVAKVKGNYVEVRTIFKVNVEDQHKNVL